MTEEKKINTGQVETTLTRKELNVALNSVRRDIANMFLSQQEYLESRGLQTLSPNKGTTNFQRNMRRNLAVIGQQTRATTALLDLPLNQIPKAIRERMISGFKKTIVNGARSPFTLAAYAGYHGIVMPIPIVIKHAGGAFYLLYSYFFVFVVIFGTRYYYVQYAENETAQQLLNFVYTTFYYVIYPTKLLMNAVIQFINVAIEQSKRNVVSLYPALQTGLGKAGELAQKGVCDNLPSWARWVSRC